jgi:hypothetical protein
MATTSGSSRSKVLILVIAQLLFSVTVRPYTGDMDSTQLSRQQLDALSFKLFPMLTYLQRLDAKLQQCHFPASDPIAVSTRETIAKLQQLMEAIHVLAVTAEKNPGYFVGYQWRREKDERRNQ